MQKEINQLVESFTEGCITKEEFTNKTLFAAGQFAEKLVTEKDSAQTDCEISLNHIENLVASKDLTLSGQALWYQQKLEEVSPTWQYVKYVYNQVGSAWTILHGRKHEIERKLLDVKVLNPTKGKGNGKKRKPKVSKSFVDQIRALPISDEEKRKLARLINVEL